MNRNFQTRSLLRSAFVASLVAAGYAASACGSDNTVTGDGASGTGGFPHFDAGTFGNGGAASGGSPGAGGASGNGPSAGGTSSGGASSGGAAGADTDGPACVVPDPSKFLPTSGFKDCDVPTLLPHCTNGKCVPAALVPKDSQALLADCADPTNKCVPTYFVERNAKFIPPSCTSLKGAEGRCLSQCIPQVAAQETFLPKDTCGDGDLCAPCYDPRTGVNTGACSQGCDVGPTKDPIVFDKCCGGIGSCVPENVVPASAQGLLGKDSCTTAGEVCAPDKLSDTTVKPKQCTSLAGAEGRCLASCIPAVAAQATRLPKDVCDTGELCAPCFDPLTSLATGACTQNGDQPGNPTPVTFPKCCGDLGHCVPNSTLTTDQQTLLGKDTCTGTDKCAPDIFAVSGEKADTCRALGSLNAEGRCIPSCVPSVSSQADRLDQGTPKTCGDGYLCAPCYDPVSGADTGACSQNGDKPTEGKKTFPGCCGGLGVCVGPALVPADEASQLGHDTCSAQGDLCAPKTLTDPGAHPPVCRAPGDIEGRCLPGCLPPIDAQKQNLRQQTCASGELCADCYNPLDGTDTKACTINGDKPTDAPKVFGACCSNLGKCVPTGLLTSTQQTQLGKDSCSGTDLCAPNVFAIAGDSAPKCRALKDFDAEGRCIPDCVPAVQAQKNNLDTGTPAVCGTGTLCAPCFDPITGLDSGACSQNGDAPAETKKQFASCGSGRGLCVPPSLVPDSLKSSLPTCAGSTYLCAPTEKVKDINYKFPSCAPQIPPFPPDPNQPAACLPKYIIDFQKQTNTNAGLLGQSNCKSGEICAPCKDPLSGATTHACD
ncbi:MAG TPA: hypothetical protein VHE30_03225 [Polyangiaceae bacterium]|nr:hypothetical protein [Polyangiaceae bacterium]